MSRIFIDVREPDEFARGHVKNALNLPPEKLVNGEPDELKKLPRDAEITVYCRAGTRANFAISILKKFGFSNLENGINKDFVKKKYF